MNFITKLDALSDFLGALRSVAVFIFEEITSCASMFSTTPLFQLFIGVVVVALIVSLVVYIARKVHGDI